MERFTQAIKKSIESENWYSALTLALTIPDICGRLSNPELANQSQKRYVIWFDKYMLHHYEGSLPNEVTFDIEAATFMSGGDCYALRCALLHEGRDDVTSQKARREVISRINFSTTGYHRIKINDILVLNIQRFCEEMCQGVQVWNEDFKDDIDVQKAIKELLTIQTQGFSPGFSTFLA